MFYKYQIIAGIVLVTIIGLIRIIITIGNIKKTILFLDEYRDTYVKLINSYLNSSGYHVARQLNPDLYSWLVSKSVKAQRELGMYGVGEFIAPFQIYKIRNYQFIVNTIPKIRDGHVREEEMNLVENILTRCLGAYIDIRSELLSELKNPLKWFQYGVKWCLSLPIRVLNWFGIINNSTVDKITVNGFFKMISGLIGFISFVSAIITIVTGWDAFKIILHKLF
jgi:hypothetical protein